MRWLHKLRTNHLFSLYNQVLGQKEDGESISLATQLCPSPLAGQDLKSIHSHTSPTRIAKEEHPPLVDLQESML